MSTQKLDNDLKLEILQWLQRYYTCKRLGRVFERDNQWMVSSFFKGDTILVLRLVRGANEARIREVVTKEVNLVGITTLNSFQNQFRKLMQ